MKKSAILAIILAMALSLSVMVSCTKKDTGKDNSSTPESSKQQKAASGQVKAVYDAVIKDIFGEEPPAMVKQEDPAQIEEMFGLKADMMKEQYISMPMMNVHVDTLIAVKAAEGKVKEVETALNAYKDKVIKDREAFPYLPDHLPKAKAAQVFTVDDYVFYVSLGKVADDVTDENMQEEMNKQVQKAVDTIKSTLKKQ